MTQSDFTQENSNFGSLGMITKTAGDMYRFIILEAWYNLEEAIEPYDKHNASDVDTTRDISIIKARLKRLIRTIGPHLNKRNNKEELEKNLTKLDKGETELFELIEYIYSFLHDIGLTKLKMTQEYDPTNPSQEDLAAGMS